MSGFLRYLVRRIYSFCLLQGSGGYLKRANSEKLHEIFNKYASTEKDGVRYMTSNDFIRGYLGIYTADDRNDESVGLLAGIVDPRKDGLISFSEFQAFEGLLCLPDALYKTAFQLFDINGNGMVSFGERLTSNNGTTVPMVPLKHLILYFLLQMNFLK